MPATRTTRRGNGAGKGDGWGGEAKGAGNHGAGPGRPTVAEAPAIQADKAARLDAVKNKIFDLAMNADRQETQLSAAVAFLNREEGTPIARSITVQTDDLASLSDADLAERLAHLERVAAAAGDGAQQAPGSGKPRGMVN